MNCEQLKAGTASGPTILLTDTNRWTLSVRLAIALARSGCRVSAVCPTPRHALEKTRAVERIFPYRALRPLESLKGAIEAVCPDVIIPCCDRSVGHLHDLHANSLREGKRQLVDLIERSLGPAVSYPVVRSRYELLKLAREEGIPVPHTEQIRSPEDVRRWQTTQPLPWVVKADGTWAGGGVRIISAAEQLRPCLQQLASMFDLRRALKRLIVNRDAFWLLPWWKGRPHEIVAQRYIHGRAANCAVACWRGRVLAGIGVEVASSEEATGPASIVRVVENRGMSFAAERIASRLNMSGLFGLDFMIEEGTGAAYLIEMNPRSTPLCHLQLGRGRDMAGALWAQLSSRPQPESPPQTEKDLIAYFPSACSGPRELLEASFLDVPEGEPELLAELRNPWPDRTLLFRLSSWLSRRRAARTVGSSISQVSVKNRSASQASDCTSYEAAELKALPAGALPRNRHDIS